MNKETKQLMKTMKLKDELFKTFQKTMIDMMNYVFETDMFVNMLIEKEFPKLSNKERKSMKKYLDEEQKRYSENGF